MRRNEKQMTNSSDIEKVLQSGRIMRLAMCKDNQPYLVPLSYGYDGKFLYFHCAKEGRKVDLLRVNPLVCFEVTVDAVLKTATDKPCSWGFHFRSVIGSGRAVEVTSHQEKLAALECLMAQYSSDSWSFSDAGTTAGVAATMVWRIEILKLEGKQG